MNNPVVDLRFLPENPRIAVVSLNRPASKNAINQAMIDGLHEILDQLSENPDVGAMILIGEGDDFAAGADIGELCARGAEDSLQGINSRLFYRIEQFRVPVIASIRGFALGGGCELALACDIRVAGRSARMGQPEVRFGIIPGAGATQRLPRIVGMGRAREMILTACILDATQCLAIGLVNHVVDDDAVFSLACDLAKVICKQPPMTIQLAKQALNQSVRSSPEAGMAFESAAQAVLFESPEKKARMTAFLKKGVR